MDAEIKKQLETCGNGSYRFWMRFANLIEWDKVATRWANEAAGHAGMPSDSVDNARALKLAFLAGVYFAGGEATECQASA